MIRELHETRGFHSPRITGKPRIHSGVFTRRVKSVGQGALLNWNLLVDISQIQNWNLDRIVEELFTIFRGSTVAKTFWIWAGIAVLSLVPSVGWCQEKGFRAGAFAQNVSPTKFPISVNGGMADRLATKIHDPLHARCLVLDDGATKIALVVCDSCMVPRDVCDKANGLASQKTGIPASNILISATHTHTAPTLTHVFQSPPDEDYKEFLVSKIAEGIVAAHARLEPAKIGFGVGKDPTQVFNRRWKVKEGSSLLVDPFGKGTDKVRMNPGRQHGDLIEPAGPIDPDVSLLSVQTLAGKPLAIYANYSLHYVGGVPELSADYFAMFAERMRELVGGDKSFLGVMSNGTSGNINNVNFADKGPGAQKSGEQARIVAESVAKAAYSAYQKITYNNQPKLSAQVRELVLGVRKPTPPEIERAEALLTKAKEAGRKVLVGLPEIYANETVAMAKYPDKVSALVQVLRVGDTTILAAPCEIFVEIGLAMKKGRPNLFTVSLANGYAGYLPTPEHHALGGYETWRARSSFLEEQASVRIQAAWSEMLK